MPDPTPTSISSSRAGWSSLFELSKYQWFVFIVASMAWMLDCMDQQFFTLARTSAMRELVPIPATDDPRIEAYARSDKTGKLDAGNPEDRTTILQKIYKTDVSDWGGYSTSAFLIGWALGGLAFGVMGDRKGRVKTLTFTILIYAIFTGFSAFSLSVWDFLLYRLLTGLGVGGVFAVVVALIAETVPDRARPYSLGLLQSLSAVGNCSAALTFMFLGYLQQAGHFENLYILGMGPVKPWRLMFLVGIIPALLAIVIQLKVQEPEQWRSAVSGSKKRGSFSELLGDRRWRSRALFGLLLAIAGVVGLWGIGFFAVDLQQSVLKKTLKAEGEALGLIGDNLSNYVDGSSIYWAGITSMVLNIGAALGMLSFSWLTSFTGRKPAFAIAFLAAAASTSLVFATMSTRVDILWMVPLMGFCQLAIFGGYAIYFPELFPTRLRSTGTSFCYNVGRLIAALGPTLLALMSTRLFGHYEEPMRWAGVTMCSIFFLGLFALPFLPETKGKPLPEG